MNLISRIRDKLAELYGTRLKGVVLYGSEARGEAQEDSDIDLLVLLEPPIKLGKEIQTIVHALYPLQLEVIRPIHAMPTDAKAYEAGEIALYRHAKQEGISV